MDYSFASNNKPDLSFILASPKLRSSSKVKSKLDQVDKIIQNMKNYNTTKVDIEQINKDAKLEAKKGFYDEIDGLRLPSLLKNDQTDLFGFNKICSQINKGLNRDGIFKNQPLLVFKKDDFYGDKMFDEALVKDVILNKRDKLKMFKTAIKMLSIESSLDNILTIKKLIIDEMISVSIVDLYATLVKILINYGIDLELLDKYVIKYSNIKDNAIQNFNQPKDANGHVDLNIIQSFIHIVDLIEISIDTTKLLDNQILADYVSIILILFSEPQWRFNLQCLSSLGHLFTIILKRIDNSTTTVKLVSKVISKFFKGKPSKFFEFLDFFPDHTTNLSNIKFALCKIQLKKHAIKVGHTEQRVDHTFTRLKEIRSSNNDEIKLVLAFIDHFYQTRELTNELSQQISDRLSSFVKDYEFESENQSSIEFKVYLNSLVDKYDRKPKNTPIRKKVKGEQQSRPRKVALNDKEVKKIWEQVELDLDD